MAGASLRADVLRSVGIGAMNNDPTGGNTGSTVGINPAVQDAFMGSIIDSGLQPVIEVGARYPFNSGTKGIHKIINRGVQTSSVNGNFFTYTVTTGKTLYITGIYVYNNQGAVAENISIVIDSVTVFQVDTTNVGVGGGAQYFNFITPWVCTSTFAMNEASTNAKGGFMVGWEE